MRWTTRARPHVDRCATAWLVKRFVDPSATFSFVEEGAPVPKGATPFDLPGAKHGHRGEACTFETVMADHKLGHDDALRWIAARVHDIDFHALELPESPGIDALLRGLLLAHRDDHEVLRMSAALFEALYLHARSRQEKVPA